MRQTRRLTALLLVASACSSNPQSESAPRGDRTTLTQKEMLDHHFQTAYEAVEALRGQWLQARGPDSFSTPSQVWVYMDNVKLGDVQSLRTVHPSTILAIRHFDPNAATARWGVGHAAGVIYLESFPAGSSTPAPSQAGDDPDGVEDTSGGHRGTRAAVARR